MTPARTICLGFLALICIGALLLMLPYATADGKSMSFLISLFTATSAVCVNGLTVVDVETHFSLFGQIILLCLVQLGGLGYMTSSSFLILLVGKKISLKHRFNIGESLALDFEHLSDLRHIIKGIIKVTLVIETIGAVMLFTVFIKDFSFVRSVWLSVFHSINAFNRAGFSLFSDSFESYHPIGLYIIVPFLALSGGIGYHVIYDLCVNFRNRVLGSGRIRGLFAFTTPHNAKRVEFSMYTKVVLRMTVALLTASVVGFYFLEDRTGQSVSEGLLSAWFTSSASVTAGFSISSRASEGSVFLAIILMFIGAAPGGTGGGIKVTTVWILLASFLAVIRGRTRVISCGREIPLENILKAVALTVGSFMMIMLFTFGITLFDGGISFMHILHEVVSAYGTVGLSHDVTGRLSVPSQYILVATMYIGRVNILLLVAALLGGDRTSYIRYPSGRLLVE